MTYTKIEQWQVFSSLDHSSLIVLVASYTLKFLIDAFLNCRIASFPIAISFAQLYSTNMMSDSYTTPSHSPITSSEIGSV